MSSENSQHTVYREVTFAAIALGILQGVIMTAAFTYAGLQLGFTIGGSTLAAIMGFVLLRVFLGKGSIAENNINQTIASGINTTAGGIIFTLPALFLMGHLGQSWEKDFPVLVSIVLSATAGSFLGVAMIIPIRKQMIDFERLRFPSGSAVAVILKSPGAGMKKGILMVVGTLLSSALALAIHLHYLPHDWNFGELLDLPGYTRSAVYLSLMNLGAGLLAGRGGLPMLWGGILAYWILAPLAVSFGFAPTLVGPDVTAAEQSAHLTSFTYFQLLRPLGIGILIGGAIMGVILALPVLKNVFRSLSQVSQTLDDENPPDELNMKVIYLAVVGCFLFITATCLHLEPELGIGRSLLVSFAGLVWMFFAGMIVAQCTGMTDTSPLSGMSLIAVTLILFLSGSKVMLTIVIGVTVCVAIAQCVDMMQDLKTGFLIGGIPVKQQTVQLCVAWIGPLVSVAVVCILWKYGMEQHGFGPGTKLQAPQADALQAIIVGLQEGNAPLMKYLSGGILGALVTLLPVGGIGVLIGLAMYLPFSITLGYGMGCLLNMAIVKVKGLDWTEDWITPLAAGLIVGEALMGLGTALHSMGVFGG